MEKLHFSSDYMEGAHPAVLDALVKTNLISTPGYGTDDFCNEARKKILLECGCPDGEVHFLVGGTQTNATVISSMLSSWQGVISADSGHVSVHEAGAIEFYGHKVLPLKHTDGKISAQQVASFIESWKSDKNNEHIVEPGMVYISQPTEYGTLYTKKELESLSKVCKTHEIPLYVDGARLAYALAAPENDVSLKDLASFCDAFYIGGTKCGLLFGEAVVFPKKNTVPHFFTITKQHGAMLAKGRLLGVQFDALFTNGLYYKIGEVAIKNANRIRKALIDCGIKLFGSSTTNQVFFILENEKLEKLGQKIEYGFFENYTESSSVVRFATSWSTTDEMTDLLVQDIHNLN